ncbi:hypothetical protein TNCV_2857151 [Trichonephila clavipes]|nr:hypothetical protein TNCV_2857151 [Trichonephila clavipes]
MLSFVRLFDETLAEEYVAVGFLYGLLPTSREDDRFGVISYVLAFVRNGRYPEQTFLPSKSKLPHNRVIRYACDLKTQKSVVKLSEVLAAQIIDRKTAFYGHLKMKLMVSILTAVVYRVKETDLKVILSGWREWSVVF